MPPEESIHSPTPSAYAERLEELALRLRARLEETPPGSQPDAVDQHVAALLEVVAGLRGLTLLFDVAQAGRESRREEEIRSIARTIQESLRGLAEGNQQFTAEMGDKIHELRRLADLPAGEDLGRKLHHAIVHVGQAAERMGKHVEAATARVGHVNRRIASLEQELTEAREKADHDGLTSLYSRAALNERLEVAIGKGLSEGPWCFLIGDMDYFKRVNDRFGHLVGDAILCHVARLLEESVRREDQVGFVARYGGEEFGIILPRTTPQQAASVGERIRRAVAGARWNVAQGTQRHVLQTTLSVGGAPYVTGDAPAALIHRADGALYRAKQAGRNRVVVVES